MAPRADYPEDWQLQCGEIKQRGAHILQSGVWSDCSFLVGEQPDQVVVKAHKLILAMASPVFEAMFYGPIAEGNNPIPIPDIQLETFRGLLEYIYTDNIELDSFDAACNLYYGAQKYMLTHLLTVCTMYLSCNLTPEVACQMYEFALMVGEDSLIKECEQMIISETSSILLLKGFEESSIETVEKIFSMNNLNISSELDLFKALERYAIACNLNKDYTKEENMNSEKCESGCTHGERTEEKGENDEMDKENTVTKDNGGNVEDEQFEFETGKENCDSKDDDVKNETGKENRVPKDNEESSKNGELQDHSCCIPSSSNKQIQEPDFNGKTKIRKLVQQIRFLTLTPCELAEYPTMTSLLTESEILAVMMNTASTNTHMPMPEGFSVSRTKR